MSPSLDNFETLPILNPSVPNTGNTLAPLAGVPSAPSSGSSNTPSSGFTSFFGTRGIAIILGLIFIFGSILLFTGEDIGGAVAKVAAA